MNKLMGATIFCLSMFLFLVGHGILKTDRFMEGPFVNTIAIFIFAAGSLFFAYKWYSKGN